MPLTSMTLEQGHVGCILPIDSEGRAVFDSRLHLEIEVEAPNQAICFQSWDRADVIAALRDTYKPDFISCGEGQTGE